MPDAVRSTTRLTYDDLVAMFPDEDGVRRELIDGELFVTPSPFIQHQADDAAASGLGTPARASLPAVSGDG